MGNMYGAKVCLIRFCGGVMKFFFVFILMFSLSGFANELSLELAKKIALKASQYATKKSWKISIAIVNSEGNLVYFERGNGTYFGSVGSSQEKAQSSNAFQRPTSAFVEAVRSGKLGLISGKNIVAIEGGVPITIKGKHVGAIGISGAKAIEDEEIAKEAVKVASEI